MFLGAKVFNLRKKDINTKFKKYAKAYIILHLNWNCQYKIM